MTALKKEILRAISAPAIIFFLFKNIFLFFRPENKKYFFQQIPARITPLHRNFFFAGIGLLGVIFSLFALPAAAENEINAAADPCPNAAAAKTGSLEDEYLLARAYDKGTCGLSANKESAQRWYLDAADQGHVLAQYQLAEKYFTGDGGTPDYPQAKKWYLKSAAQGHGLSQLRLAYLYAESHFAGLTTNYSEAEKWFLKAAGQNAGDAQFRLGNFYHNYKNPPELQKAVYWLTRSAEGGNRVAMFDLSRMLRNGEGAPKDLKQSLVWMEKAAELDLLSAQITLSRMYAEGKDVPKDPLRSLSWTLKIASEPMASSYWLDKAADVFFDGWDSIPKSYPQAMKFYERAAAKNDPHALARLSRMYRQGLGVLPDPKKARDYLSKAADGGDDEAKALLLAK